MTATLIDLAVSMGRGLAITAWLTMGGCALALACAFLFGLGRVSERRAVRAISIGYIELFRGTSVFVQIFWLYYALPAFGILLSPMVSGIVALGLNVGAYGAEIVRSAVGAVGRDQAEASTALNLTRWQSLRYIILPQAVPRMIPVFGNNAVELLKATAIVSLISLSDITFQAQQFRIRTGQTIMPFIVTLLLYFMLYLLILHGVRRAERAYALPSGNRPS
ncbi:ectoine/hydroxyectoine ABC transporter permease subunit EhuC [Gluconacetobacter azotocaptans]|uniref:Ectoine/hydroxyectoine ABC transporter permease subunit EhuC n=1 Tax=Gluconacetobacter azotocaptans TaxID=142834 RepID=A0A7W4JQA3_9PROT|nr:ectoine/hydroxyectoine ABC transporter permease subunit EhuC [Gluconacetobacter azotocaptans]MBB2188916.1 ectoine/hydroxyectoine ABC transporter permease subunit EhuC [Gluconacetobacter azotocaptans]MBM9401512.1 ectoine/hydroxyectoine ABC transporter permease subunit EhuC [Gluconacetobacter azotocaptans]GBQ26020.1 amino acid ABC transporter permease [Gluconacetobacter azotocaptans DSM 13594]